MVTWSDVVAIAPELASVPEAAQTAILTYVEEQLASTPWGDRLATGQALLSAHYGTLRGAPSFKMQRVGQHQKEAEGDLKSTSYGREYLRLIRTLPTCRAAVLT